MPDGLAGAIDAALTPAAEATLVDDAVQYAKRRVIEVKERAYDMADAASESESDENAFGAKEEASPERNRVFVTKGKRR